MQASVGLGAVQRVGRFLDSGQGLLRLRPRSKPEVGEHRIVVWFAVCNAPFRPACRPIWTPVDILTSPKGLAKRRLLVRLAPGVQGLELLARHPADDAVHQRGWRIHLLGDSSVRSLSVPASAASCPVGACAP